MASVFNREGKWYLRFKDERGLWKQLVSTAQTKTEAKRLSAELEKKAEAVRLGLAEKESAGPTVSAILAWYCEAYLKGRPSHETAVRACRLHLEPALGHLRLAELTAGHIETLLQQKADALGPQTLNHLRGYLTRAISRARRAGRWKGDNPAAQVETRRIPRRQYDYLRTEEVPRLLEELAPEYRPLFAIAIYTGLRKGELLALRKSDVDLKSRLLTVSRSFERDTTKGGHADVIPIAAEAVPYFELAIRESRSELVFPNADGGMRRRDFKAQAILQRALSRARIVAGWKLVCRRKGCGYFELSETDREARCPKCNMRLWPKAKPRPLRFHDLRGTCASLLIQAGASLAAVAAVLRHSDPNLTIQRYAHMSPGYLRQEIDRLSFRLPSAEKGSEERKTAPVSEAFAALVLQTPPDAENAKAGTPEFPQGVPALASERRTGFEPATPSLGSSCSTN
jgi:integrase